MKSNYSEFLKETMESIGGYGKVNPELIINGRTIYKR